MPELSTPQKTCPECGMKGMRVDGATVKAMLSISLRHVREIPYRFCAVPGCDVVYFSEDGVQTFSAAAVRERVYQKEPGVDEVLICYCFRHTPGDIRQQFAQSNETSILDDIHAGIQSGQCACDWRNPQGNCCLGNVRAFIEQLRSANTSTS